MELYTTVTGTAGGPNLNYRITDDLANSIMPLFCRVMAADFSPLTIITPALENQ